MARIVLRSLVAWDATASAAMAVKAGALIGSCRILRNPAAAEDRAAEVYVMEFESGGRSLRCPLVDFQARTQAIQPVLVEESPARETAPTS